MNSKITFCEDCRKDVLFSTKNSIESHLFKGENIEYIAITAACDECGSEVYVGEYMDANIKALYDVYRRKHDIILLEHIREIPVKYAIGKRPLSLLLGWGELTFTRYCEGDIPSKHYAATLKRLYNDPAFYLSILENNKENLKLSSYQKSKNTVQKLLSSLLTDNSKLNNIAKYILCECNDITNLALQKSLYYIQGFYSAFNGKYLFEDDCEAWVHGPVYRDIYQQYANYGFGSIDCEALTDDFVFTTDEKILVDSVIRYLCCYSGKTLERFTHIELPWLKTRGDLPPKEPSVRIINKELINSYFKAVKSKYSMLTPADIKLYSAAMFEKI